MNVGIVIGLIKALAPGVDPEIIEQAVMDWLDDHPEATTTVQDGSITEAKLAQDVLADLAEISSLKEAIEKLDPSATSGDVGKFLKAKTVSDGKVTEWELGAAGGGGSVDLFYVTPEDYGAVGDGETDDSQAVQDAVDAGYAVYFASNKTYYLADSVTIDHDCRLFGGEKTVIKTKTPSGGIANEAFIASGTLKKTTTLTSDYTINGETANVGDKFVLTDMTGVAIGDIMEIIAEDQLYSPCRGYYYKGGVLLVSDVTESAIFTCDALPFDIDNSEDVSVKVYSAPQVVMENLKFISDHDSAGEYVYMAKLTHCKNSIVRNCTVTDADNGFYIGQSVNTLVDCVTVANMPLSGTGRAMDHYGIAIYSSTNTTVRRVMGNAANSCIDLSGTFPNINTRIKECNLFALSRHNGLGMHENVYNTVIEDCVVGGMTAYGTVFVNRCRFVRSFRDSTKMVGINFTGASDNPKHGRLVVENCVIDEGVAIQIPTPNTQDSPQEFNHMIDEVIVKNCVGGRLQYTPTTTAYVLSNTIKNIVLENWRDCYEFYHTSDGKVENMVVKNCNFIQKRWINDHQNHASYGGIHCVRVINDCEQKDEIYINIDKYGGSFVLPEGVQIGFTAANSSDRFVICGENLASNVPGDYVMGAVSGSTGGTLSTSANSNFSNALSANENGEIVWTQPDNTTSVNMFPFYMVYAPKNTSIKTSCILKNTGATEGATFRPNLAVVSCETGKITYRNNHGTVQATAQGAEATHERDIEEDSLVLFFLYCSTPIANSVTTISNYTVEVQDMEFGHTPVFKLFEGSSRTGTGSLESVEGVNNIFSSVETFAASFKAKLNR